MCLYYFAYGSNMNQARMKKRCKGCAKFTLMFGGIMKKWKLVFNKEATDKEGVGWANIEQNDVSVVEGIIYKINEKCRDELDFWEGYPDDYQRPDMPVETDNGELDCIVYIANPTKVKEGLKPPKWYLDHLLKGEKFLSPNYVSNLKKIQTLD